MVVLGTLQDNSESVTLGHHIRYFPSLNTRCNHSIIAPCPAFQVDIDTHTVLVTMH